jgi:serine/threonine-protein kinase
MDGRYRLVERLALGGSSTVWRAWDERLARPVAVKVLDDAPATWIRGEARALAKLVHPHIATVFDAGAQDDQAYLVTELVEGWSLAEALADGPLPWASAVECAAQVAAALAVVHARGLVHRDVTPANIMLTAAGAKLIDFGISAFAGEPEAGPDGQVRGTPPYAAPERRARARVTPASDVYSLGVVLYAALTAERPEPGLPALYGLDGLPPEVAKACRECVAEDPAARPTAEELVRRLPAAPAKAGPTVASAAAAVPSMTRVLPTMTYQALGRGGSSRWLIAGIAVLVVGIVAGLSIGLGLHRDSSSAPSGPAAAAGPGCSVSYQLTSDDGNTYTAKIVTTNTGSALPDGWRLDVQLPSGNSDGLRLPDTWSLAGSTMTSPAQGALDVGGSNQMILSVRHSKTTVLPTSFAIGGHPCTAGLLGPDGSTLAPGATFVDNGQSGDGHGHGHDGGSDGGGGPGPN